MQEYEKSIVIATRLLPSPPSILVLSVVLACAT